jgi:hypothetical protein
MRLNPFDKVMRMLSRRVQRMAAACAALALIMAVLAPVQHPLNDTDLGQNLIVLSAEHGCDSGADTIDLAKQAHAGCATYMDLVRPAGAPRIDAAETRTAFAFPAAAVLRSAAASSPFKPPRA